MASFPLSALVKPASLIGIVDIGASEFEEAPPYLPLLQANAARLVGFEADAAECEKLRKKYPAPSAFFPYFIGDGSAATFYQTNWAATGSLFRPNQALLEVFQNLHEFTTLVAEHPVQTKRLDDVEDIGDVDFMKLDVQGAELMVLQGAQRVLQGVSVILVEVEFVELYERQPLFADVDRHLRSQGFVFHTLHGVGLRCFKPLMYADDRNRGMNQYLWADAVYVRDWAKLAAMPVDKIVKYAALVHELFASPDLCHFLLEHLDARLGTSHARAYLEKLQTPG
jgi:FkbM family methyltransferase